MLIEFRIENHRSYRDEQVLSLVAGPGKELLENAVPAAALGEEKVLRSAAVYGANASGKSTLIHAMYFFSSFINRSAEQGQVGDPVPVEPFLLDEESRSKPSKFEVTFLLDGVRHQYGFVVSPDKIEEEWLTVYPQRMPQRWFRRTLEGKEQCWTFSPHFRGEKQQIAKLTRPNALFLSVGAQLNHPQLAAVVKWFRSHFRVLSRETPGLVGFTTSRCHRSDSFCSWLMGFLQTADLGIHGIAPATVETNTTIDDRYLPPHMTEEEKRKFLEQYRKREVVEMIRRLPSSGQEVRWALERESDGTQRLFGLLGPWHDVLENGWTLFVDELDASMHPLMSRKLVEIFNSPEHNRKGAQLVFTTHDTTLLDTTLLRRDQIWFTEKDGQGATHLYSLQEYHPRKTESIQRGYLAGRYGAVPFLGEVNF